jgi:hypothetical protein
MISERLLARSYSSFWKDLLPFSEAFVRGVNSRWERLTRPTSDYPEPLERAVVNEGAVRLFRLICEGKDFDASTALIAVQESAAWLDCPGIEIGAIGIWEVLGMAHRMHERFGSDNLTFAPSFRGCGILSACRADLLVRNTLVEIKSGYRSFRSQDFRQIIVYLTLNYLDESYVFDCVCLYNARTDRCVEIGVDELCRQLAGSSTNEVLARVADFITTGIVSGT